MTDRKFSEEQVLLFARRAYEEGAASFAGVPEKCALLVIDMQDEFVKPGWSPYWVPDATRAVPAISRLIAHCRKAGVPVVFTVFSRTHGYLDRPASGGMMPNRFPDVAVDPSQFFVKGLKVVVGSDVTATDDPRMQEPELMVLRKGFARVLAADEIIGHL